MHIPLYSQKDIQKNNPTGSSIQILNSDEASNEIETSAQRTVSKVSETISDTQLAVLPQAIFTNKTPLATIDNGSRIYGYSTENNFLGNSTGMFTQTQCVTDSAHVTIPSSNFGIISQIPDVSIAVIPSTTIYSTITQTTKIDQHMSTSISRPPSLSSDDDSFNELIIDENPVPELASERTKLNLNETTPKSCCNSNRNNIRQELNTNDSVPENIRYTSSSTSCIQNNNNSKTESLRKPQEIKQSFISTNSSDNCESTNSLLAYSPAYRNTDSMYIPNPNFSNYSTFDIGRGGINDPNIAVSKHQYTPNTTTSANSLSSLHMNPPDFTKTCNRYTSTNGLLMPKSEDNSRHTMDVRCLHSESDEISNRRKCTKKEQEKNTDLQQNHDSTKPYCSSRVFSYNYPKSEAPDFSKSALMEDIEVRQQDLTICRTLDMNHIANHQSATQQKLQQSSNPTISMPVVNKEFPPASRNIQMSITLDDMTSTYDRRSQKYQDDHTSQISTRNSIPHAADSSHSTSQYVQQQLHYASQVARTPSSANIAHEKQFSADITQKMNHNNVGENSNILDKMNLSPNQDQAFSTMNYSNSYVYTPHSNNRSVSNRTAIYQQSAQFGRSILNSNTNRTMQDYSLQPFALSSASSAMTMNHLDESNMQFASPTPTESALSQSMMSQSRLSPISIHIQQPSHSQPQFIQHQSNSSQMNSPSNKRKKHRASIIPATNIVAADFIDLTKSPISRREQQSNQLYNNSGLSSIGVSTKTHPSKKSTITTPANTIMDPYVFRHTSEQELNLEIITKTLKMDARVLPTKNTPQQRTQLLPPMMNKQMSCNIQNNQHNALSSSFQRRTQQKPVAIEPEPCSSSLARTALQMSTSAFQPISVIEPKINVASSLPPPENIVHPLDLSVKTVTTKADSTDSEFRINQIDSIVSTAPQTTQAFQRSHSSVEASISHPSVKASMSFAGSQISTLKVDISPEFASTRSTDILSSLSHTPVHSNMTSVLSECQHTSRPSQEKLMSESIEPKTKILKSPSLLRSQSSVRSNHPSLQSLASNIFLDPTGPAVHDLKPEELVYSSVVNLSPVQSIRPPTPDLHQPSTLLLPECNSHSAIQYVPPMSMIRGNNEHSLCFQYDKNVMVETIPSTTKPLNEYINERIATCGASKTNNKLDGSVPSFLTSGINYTDNQHPHHHYRRTSSVELHCALCPTKNHIDNDNLAVAHTCCEDRKTIFSMTREHHDCKMDTSDHPNHNLKRPTPEQSIGLCTGKKRVRTESDQSIFMDTSPSIRAEQKTSISAPSNMHALKQLSTSYPAPNTESHLNPKTVQSHSGTHTNQKLSECFKAERQKIDSHLDSPTHQTNSVSTTMLGGAINHLSSISPLPSQQMLEKSTISDETAIPAEIDSFIEFSRIRTKGELKVYTTIPTNTFPDASTMSPTRKSAASKTRFFPAQDAATYKTGVTFEERLKAEFAEFSNINLNIKHAEIPTCKAIDDIPTVSKFDLSSWDNVCHDLQQQLGTESTTDEFSGTYTSSKNQTTETVHDFDFDRLTSDYRTKTSLPGLDYQCTIDPHILFNVHENEKLRNTTFSATKKCEGHMHTKTLKTKSSISSSSSSDEDTPLDILRQQSLNGAKMRSKVGSQTSRHIIPTSAGSRNDLYTKMASSSSDTEDEKYSTGLFDTIRIDNQMKHRRPKMVGRPRIPQTTLPCSKLTSSISGKLSSTTSSPSKKSDKNIEAFGINFRGTENDAVNNNTKYDKHDNEDSELMTAQRLADTLEWNPMPKTSNENSILKRPEPHMLVRVIGEHTNAKSSGSAGYVGSNDIRKRPIEPKTMTRSKRRAELEHQRANRKVLRSDKITKNMTSKIEGNKLMFTRITAKGRILSKSWKNNEKNKKNGKTTKLKQSTRLSCQSLANLPKRRGSISRASFSVSCVPDGALSAESNFLDDSRLRARNSKTIRNSDVDKQIAHQHVSAAPSIDAEPERRLFSEKRSNVCKRTNPIVDELCPNDWKEQLYRYKRSLKIPASLITIGRSCKSTDTHCESISLPELHSQHSIETPELCTKHEQCLLEKHSLGTNKNGTPSTSKIITYVKEPLQRSEVQKSADIIESRHMMSLESDRPNVNSSVTDSIIDLLHQRVITPCINTVTSKLLQRKHRIQSPHMKILPLKNMPEMLSTPGLDNELAFHKHQNVFETPVMTSRTRREQRYKRRQDIIRGVFGCGISDVIDCTDRPSSAPPLNSGIVLLENDTQTSNDQYPSYDTKDDSYSSYDQKYEKYLQKLNFDIGDRIRKNRTVVAKPLYSSNGDIKSEEIKKYDVDLVLNENDDNDDNDDGGDDDYGDDNGDDNDNDDNHQRKIIRGPRSCLRRKGSSGFDYIRKKKKAALVAIKDDIEAYGRFTSTSRRSRRSAAVNFLQHKEEPDIVREIRGWVLRKGHGESVLHKAARLGYIDVIAYCLVRMNMSPNQKDNAGYTPLHEACSHGSLDIAKLLLRFGANHSEAAYAGKRPLHEAVENGFVEIVRLLLAYGADPGLAMYGGKNQLWNQTKLRIYYLLPNLFLIIGQTPIMLAEENDMICLLKNHQQDIQYTGPDTKAWRFEGAWYHMGMLYRMIMIHYCHQCL